MKRNNWTFEEINICVVLYLYMIGEQSQGNKVNKSKLYKKASELMNGFRNPKAIEYRMLNISFMFKKLGFDTIKGLNANAGNIGVKVEEMIKASIMLNANVKEPQTIELIKKFTLS